MDVTPSALQRAMALPKILSEIFECIGQDYGCRCPRSSQYADDRRSSENWVDRWGLLALCGRVCKLWFAEAMPVIWRDIHPFGPNSKYLEQRFADIEPSRRQCYANFVARATIEVSCQRGSTGAARVDEVLKALKFPRLKHIELHIWHGGLGDHIPAINAPNVRCLELDPYSDSLAREVNGETWDAVLQQVPTLFPLIESAEVTDAATIWSTSVDEFLRRLPRLRKLRGHLNIDRSDRNCEPRRASSSDRVTNFEPEKTYLPIESEKTYLPIQGDIQIAGDSSLSILIRMQINV